MKKTFKIEVDCAVCAGKIEETIKKIEGVISCSVNYIMQKMVIEVNDSDFDVVLKKAIKAAKKIEPDFEIEL